MLKIDGSAVTKKLREKLDLITSAASTMVGLSVVGADEVRLLVVGFGVGKNVRFGLALFGGSTTSCI